MISTYHERFEELRRITGCGQGALEGSVTVDQVYAHYQHEHLEFRHPRGGEALYLQKPLFMHFRFYLEQIAQGYLKDGGRRAMEQSMEHLSDQVEIHAPVEFADLRRSGHPVVTLGRETVYDRPPKVHRLSERELRAKARLRKLPPEILGFIWWHVMGHRHPPPRHSRWAEGVRAARRGRR